MDNIGTRKQFRDWLRQHWGKGMTYTAWMRQPREVRVEQYNAYIRGLPPQTGVRPSSPAAFASSTMPFAG
jgi:hypothetical protein